MSDVYVAQGHGRRPDGSFDPGATDGIHSEQRDSKPVADACTRVLRNAGITVFSESEEHDDPNYRGTTARANDMGVDCVVSFHYDWNQAPPGAFAIATTDQGRELGWAIENRVQEAGFDIRDYPDDRDGLYLLDNSHAPAVIFECGRIGHHAIDETHEQKAMGEAAARGVLDWLGVRDMSFSKGLSADQWRNLYELGIAGGASADAVAAYWTDPARTDEQHERASAELFETLAERQSGSVDSTARRIARSARDSINGLLDKLRRV